MVAMYDNVNTFKKTFDDRVLPEYLRQAQWAEIVEIKKIISEIAGKLHRPINLLDIGVGNGRVIRHLSSIDEIWDQINLYHGIDNAKACIEVATSQSHSVKNAGKVYIQQLDATNLSFLNHRYDLIICTWFTAGNFYPENFSFLQYNESHTIFNLDNNHKFSLIFRQAYNLLSNQGEIVIGSVYMDNDQTRKKQELFYKNFGMKVITCKEDSFTATEEGFWSQRFTHQKIYDYLSFIDMDKIQFIPLDTYNFALAIRIKK